MARTKKGKGKGRTISVDMTDSGGSFKCRDGCYAAIINEIDQDESSNGNDMLVMKISTDEGSKLIHNCSLLPQALWNLRSVLEACGMEVPEEAIDLDLNDLEGSGLGIEVENEVYQGKKRPRIVDTFPLDELDERVTEFGDNSSGEEDETEDEPEIGEDTGEESEIVEGSSVTCDDGDVGTVTSIDGDTVTVDVDGEEYDLEMGTLTLNEEEPEEEPEPDEDLELTVGCTVTFEDDEVEYEGVVSKLTKKKVEVDVDNETWELKPDDLTVTEAAE